MRQIMLHQLLRPPRTKHATFSRQKNQTLEDARDDANKVKLAWRCVGLDISILHFMPQPSREGSKT